MTKKGTKIPDLTKGQVREQLTNETGPKAIKRFTALAVKYVAADEPIELVYFPTVSTDLNPTEEYWRRLNLTLGNHHFVVVMKSDQQSGQHSNRSVHQGCINTSVLEYTSLWPGP